MEKQYLDLLKDVLEHGSDRMDRTGVGTRALFGKQMRFTMDDIRLENYESHPPIRAEMAV